MWPRILWTSCRSSAPAVQAVVMQARLLSGRYRCDKLLAKWTGGSERCSLPGCGDGVGDIVHLLSGCCHALRETLSLAISRGLQILSSYPILHFAATCALESKPADWVRFILDPSTSSPHVIWHRQEFGDSAVFPIFRFSRTVNWSMHRHRLQLKKLWTVISWFMLVFNYLMIYINVIVLGDSVACTSIFLANKLNWTAFKNKFLYLCQSFHTFLYNFVIISIKST